VSGSNDQVDRRPQQRLTRGIGTQVNTQTNRRWRTAFSLSAIKKALDFAKFLRGTFSDRICLLATAKCGIRLSKIVLQYQTVIEVGELTRGIGDSWSDAVNLAAFASASGSLKAAVRGLCHQNGPSPHAKRQLRSRVSAVTLKEYDA
jgi:hypothetical protein